MGTSVRGCCSIEDSCGRVLEGTIVDSKAGDTIEVEVAEGEIESAKAVATVHEAGFEGQAELQATAGAVEPAESCCSWHR
jgi:hypothetical protein